LSAAGRFELVKAPLLDSVARFAHSARVGAMPGPSPDTHEIDSPYVEAILEWGERGVDPAVERWLAERGFGFLPMRAGLLLTGSPASFEAAFGVDLEQVEPPVQLEVPEDLRGAVASVTIPPPREMHK